jgi:transcriptional regulator with XRE-family HTH domain
MPEKSREPGPFHPQLRLVLRILRKRRGLAQYDVARQIRDEEGKPRSGEWLNQIESGRRRLDPDLAVQVADILKVNRSLMLRLVMLETWPVAATVVWNDLQVLKAEDLASHLVASQSLPSGGASAHEP